MEYTIIIILLALLQYIYFTGKTGFSRVKHGVNAPSITGNIFSRSRPFFSPLYKGSKV